MQDTGEFILIVLKNTPWWTWALLAYLILQGIRATRGGSTSFLRLSIVPLAFAAWGLWGVFDRFHGSAASIAVWIASVGAGGAFGFWLTTSVTIRANHKDRTIELPGSPMALVSALLVFGVKYVLAVLLAVQPEIRTETWFLIVDVGITGLIAGMFAGRLLSLRQKYAMEASNNPIVETST